MGKHILILDAGGTIGARHAPNGALVAGGGAETLVVALPEELRQRCSMRPLGLALSENMSLSDARRVVAEIEVAVQTPDIEGVVILHGTDTMEEVAFLSDLIVASDKPIVFTGAQRAPVLPGFDGLANLEDAVAVALCRDAWGTGTLIVFGGKILAARRATKIDSASPAAFGPDVAVLGRVHHGQVMLWASPRRRHVPFTCDALEPRVELISMALGADPRLVSLASAAPTRGLVIEALGLGNLSDAIADAAELAHRAGVLVLVASGAPAGGTAPVYDSAQRLDAAGITFARDLSPRKARILLATALGGRATDIARPLVSDFLQIHWGRDGTAPACVSERA